MSYKCKITEEENYNQVSRETKCQRLLTYLKDNEILFLKKLSYSKFNNLLFLALGAV